MRSRADYDEVMELVGTGLNDCEIARRTSIPRTTVRDWRLGHSAARRDERGNSGIRCSGNHDYLNLPTRIYSYLLGLYLGDGCLSEGRRGVFRMRIVCDSAYQDIIAECRWAMESIVPGARTYVLRRRGCTEVSTYSKHWICFFPQHGPGRKHQRPIVLTEWQEMIVQRAPEGLVRGLIHSDGCRVVANDRGVASVRYHFSNKSDDIKRIFCQALDRLDIPWTKPSDRDIAIYRKVGTARLDEFVGPKM